MPFARLLLYLATAAAIGLASYALLVEPPPTWLAITALAGYLALLTGGVVLSGFSMFADVVTEGPENARGIALTFDDGPDPATTPRVLQLLKDANATATFFLIGRKAERHPSLVRAIVEAGHGIGVHGYTHDRLFALRGPATIQNDLKRAVSAIRSTSGSRPTLFRAPIGHISPAIGHALRELGLQAVGWSVRGYDGRAKADPDGVAKRVTRRLRDGAIILLHDAAENADFVPASLAALPRILEAAERQQLPYVRVDSWLGVGSPEAVEAAHEQHEAEPFTIPPAALSPEDVVDVEDGEDLGRASDS